MLESLRSFLRNGRGVASLVGIGGAGKTTILRKVLDEFLESGDLDGVLVWSFYDDPDTNSFLHTAVQYFARGTNVVAQGTGWFHALKQALELGGRSLLVLDGLERVQRPVTDATGIYGELEDPLLRGLLVRLASTSGATKAVITSRFPISDLERWNGKGHTVFALDELDEDSAMRLIRSHGVNGSDAEIGMLAARCGRHALSTDLLGAATARFYGSDVGKAAAALDKENDVSEDQTSKLHAVLRLFDAGLSKQELDLMSRICVFRFGVSLESLADVFAHGKETLSGSLAGADQNVLGMWLSKLVDLHLVHHEADGKFSVHPAVRDHFYVRFRDAGIVHEAIGAHLTALTDRPGSPLPTEKEALDLLEELIHHSLKSGNVEHALELYSYRMGGNDHLNVTLGEYSRTYRILKAFPEVPDRSAMYFCMRAFGRFEEALEWRPRNRYIRVLNGDLARLRDDEDETTRRIARILQGERLPVPERAPDHPLCPAALHLILDQIDEAEAAALREAQISIHHDDVVRNRLAYAETLRRRRRHESAMAELDDVAVWVMKSGSHEHLAQMFLYRARLEMDAAEYHPARITIEEGLNIVEESHFKVLEADLRADWSHWWLMTGSADCAAEHAEDAYQVAMNPDVKYIWGGIRALRALLDAFKVLGDQNKVQETLESLMKLQKQVDSPDWRQTEQMLRKSA